MNKEKNMFFASCPACHHKFGIQPKYITMYLNRVIENFKSRFETMAEMLESTQSELEKKEE